MSIDNVIYEVDVLDDGTVRLSLAFRESPAGPEALIVLNPPDPPEKLKELAGKSIWGGEGSVYIGDNRLAGREGYTRIRLVDPRWM